MGLREFVEGAFELHPVAGFIVVGIIILIVVFIILVLNGVFHGLTSFGASLVNG